MVCFPAVSTETGGAEGVVGLVVRERPHGWSVELMRFRRTNVASYKVISGGKRNQLVEAYLLPSNLEHLTDLEKALDRFRDQYPIVLGGINSNIGQAHNPCIQKLLIC